MITMAFAQFALQAVRPANDDDDVNVDVDAYMMFRPILMTEITSPMLHKVALRIICGIPVRGDSELAYGH